MVDGKGVLAFPQPFPRQSPITRWALAVRDSTLTREIGCHIPGSLYHMQKVTSWASETIRVPRMKMTSEAGVSSAECSAGSEGVQSGVCTRSKRPVSRVTLGGIHIESWDSRPRCDGRSPVTLFPSKLAPLYDAKGDLAVHDPFSS